MSRASRLLLFALPFSVLALPRQVMAQSCTPADETVSGSIKTGDFSTPIDPSAFLWYRRDGVAICDVQERCNWYPFPGNASMGMPSPGTYEFMASANDYFATPWRQGATCTSCPAGGFKCSGGFALLLFALEGNFSGHVYLMPQGIPAAGVSVKASEGPGGAIEINADSVGAYNFAPPERRANNWGVRVAGDGSGAGSGTYKLVADQNLQTQRFGTTTSSNETVVDFVLWTPDHEKPSRCEPQPSNSGPGSGEASAPSSTLSRPEEPPCPQCRVGKPVDVTTGAVYFDQTDVTIPGLGPGLRFIRSYNSKLRQPGQYGAFGRGWNFTYEQRLTFPSAGVIMLRKANGNPAYFQNSVPGPDDLTFEASVPFTKASWIVKQQPGGTYIRHFRSGGEEHYDASGRLTSLVDVSNNTTTLVYDGSGRLITITEASGRALTLAYPNGQEITLSGPSGLIATYHLDGSNRLDTVTYPDLSGYTFTYDNNHRLLTVVDHAGKPIEHHEYDGTDRAQLSEIADGQERYSLQYGYQGDPFKTAVTDALNNLTIYEFREIWGVQQVTKVTGVCGSCGGGNETQEWTFDNRGRVASYKDGTGKLTTYEYVGYDDDPPRPDAGDLLGIIDHPSDGPVTRLSYTYDDKGRILTRSDAAGGQTRYTYLTNAGPDQIIEKVSDDPPVPARVTLIDYTTFGKPWHVTDPRGKTTTFGYNLSGTNGDLGLVSDPLGNDTRFGHDAMGRRTSITDPLDHTTLITYDAYGRVKTLREPDALNPTIFGYDLGGRRTSVEDPLHHVTGYDYDAYGRLWHVTDALLKRTTYLYDNMSNLQYLDDAQGKRTTFDYDDFNRVEKVTYPDTRYDSFTYDAAGRLKTRTDRKSVQTTYTYDDLGRLQSKTYSGEPPQQPPTPSVTYGYDNASQLTSATSTTDTLSWTYDLVGQMLTETSTTNASTLRYEYDPSGNRIRVDLNGALFTDSGYDDASRLSSITRGLSTYGFQYYADSRRRLLTFPNNVTADYTYDTRGRLRDIHYRLSGQTVTQTTYAYDDAGNRVSKGGDFSEDYTLYDAVYRLKEVKRGSTVTESYTYDDVGNRRSSLQHPNWIYPANSNRLESYNGTSFEYDLNGNLASKNEPGNAWVYHWNAENQLMSVDRNDTEVARFTYDPLGRRIQKVVGTVTHAFLYDGEDILRELDGASTFRFVHGPGIDEPLSRETDVNPTIYAHVDGLGSLVKVTGGQTTFTRRYDAFGNMEQGASAASYAFTGREWDPEIGLYYYRARYYDPKIGRFISEDPIGFLGDDINLYAYVWNNPVNWWDPSGLTGKRATRRNTSRGVAVQTLRNLMKDSDTERNEQCFSVCERGGGNFATSPYYGTSDDCPVQACPLDSVRRAICHVHPWIGGYPGHSGRDKKASSTAGVPSFVGQGGNVWEFDPNSRKEAQVCCKK